MLTKIQKQHDHARSDFERARKAVETNRMFTKEQADRIDLVSTHWFYGTTAFQPQLWLRGGCTGKIERAVAKLERSKSERPKLEGIMHEHKEVLTVAQESLSIQKDSHQQVSNAAAETRRMRDELVQRNPSPQLMEIERQQVRLQGEILFQKRQVANLNSIRSSLQEVNSVFQRAEADLTEAERHRQQAEQLTRESKFPSNSNVSTAANPTTDSSTNNSENYPCCPNGCGYAVTWHQSHCCGACKQGRKHGPRCERIKASSHQPSAQQQQRRDEMQRERQEKERRISQLKVKVQNSIKAGEHKVQNGFDALTNAGISLSGFGLTGGMPLTIPASAASPCACGPNPGIGPSHGCSLIKRIYQLRQTLCQHEVLLKHQKSVLSRLQVDYEQRLQTIQRQLQRVEEMMEHERSRIFETVRSLSSSSSSYPLVPPSSAPLEEEVAAFGAPEGSHSSVPIGLPPAYNPAYQST